jgi:hypothetical protein
MILFIEGVRCNVLVVAYHVSDLVVEALSFLFELINELLRVSINITL